MDQLIFASLSHTHYWYEVGMRKVPADYRFFNCSVNIIQVLDRVHCYYFTEVRLKIIDVEDFKKLHQALEVDIHIITAITTDHG